MDKLSQRIPEEHENIPELFINTNINNLHFTTYGWDGTEEDLGDIFMLLKKDAFKLRDHSIGLYVQMNLEQ